MARPDVAPQFDHKRTALRMRAQAVALDIEKRHAEADRLRIVADRIDPKEEKPR